MRNSQKLLLIAIALVPVAAYGRSAIGAPTQRAGVPTEANGQVCTQCHATQGAANSDPRGRLRIQASKYTPGQKQTIRVTLTHPTALRWGFELTARPLSDLTASGGTFTANDNVQIKCGAFPGSNDCPEGALQYATHTAAGTRPGTGGGNTWEFEWTPPATNVGEIVFFAAGNAANNSGNNQGDYIFTTQTRVLPATGCNVTGDFSVGGVVNGASFAPGGPIGFGSMISIFGTGFAPPNFVRGADRFDFRGDDNRFPDELACIKAEINDVDVPVVFVSSTQINAQAPAQVINGPVKVEVYLNKGLPNERKAEMTVQMREFTPAFFIVPGTTHIASRHPDGTPVGAPGAYDNPNTRPVRPGDVIELYGTGFGVTSPVAQAGEIPNRDQAGRVTNPFTVTVGGVTLPQSDVLYAGHSPGSISGLYQFNIRVPATAPDGNVPVSIRIAGVATQDTAVINVRR